MSAPICPYCGDGMESIGTLNHIECATKLMAEVRRLRSLINGKLDALLTATAPKEKEGGRVMDAFEEYKQVTHGMSEEGFVAYPLVQAVIEELNSWQAEDEPDMVRVQRERAEQAEADTEYHKGQAKLWHTALQDALTRADEAEAALAAERELLEAALHWLTSLKQDYDEDGNGVRKWSDVYDECVANIKRLAACAARPAPEEETP